MLQLVPFEIYLNEKEMNLRKIQTEILHTWLFDPEVN